MIVTVDSKKIRNEIQSILKGNGIGTSVYYPHPVPRLEYYQKKYGYSASEFSCSEIISDKSICLPVGPHLDCLDMLKIANALKEALI
jgi:dTDP-4-amino-4,6-dideoxygalactose transaminase